jgi:type I restriction enzyme S subunit
MSNWKDYKFSDFVEINPKVALKKGVEYSFVEMKDLSEGSKFVSPSQKRELKGGSRFENGDTLFARITPCLENGKISQVKELENGVGFGSTEFLVFRGKKGVSNTNFVHYLSLSDEVRSFAEQNMVGTSGRQRVSWQAFENLDISLPDLPTQTAIAEILSSLDDKIELNNKINQELENLAQTLFKQWFIDFEFPANLADDTLSGAEGYKSSGGVMVDSELGEIPMGWEVKKLNEFVNCYDSKRVPLSSQQRAIRKGNYPYYGAASLMDFVDDYLFDGVYVLMGEDGSVTDSNGYPVLQYVFGQFWVNNHAHVLQGTTISTELILCLLKNTNISHLVTGAVQPKLNQGNMNKISLAIPNDANILDNLEINVKSIFESVRNNSLENQELTNLRDTLLPKLISGELEVADIMAEKE